MISRILDWFEKRRTKKLYDDPRKKKIEAAVEKLQIKLQTDLKRDNDDGLYGIVVHSDYDDLDTVGLTVLVNGNEADLEEVKKFVPEVIDGFGTMVLLSPMWMRGDNLQLFRKEKWSPEQPLGICKRCKQTVYFSYEDCMRGKEIEGNGTEPHIFE